MPKTTRARSAVDGQFVTPDEVMEHPETTVTEAVPDPDELLDHLASLRDAIEDECAVQPDIIKAALQRIASGIDTLANARWQVQALSGPRVLETK